MATMNKQERDKFANDLKDKSFGGIRGAVHRKDHKSRLAYFRNVQESGKFMTRYVLEGLGAQVTVYEAVRDEVRGSVIYRKYSIDQIVVEST